MRMGYRLYPQPTHQAKAASKKAAARNRLKRQRALRKLGKRVTPEPTWQGA